MHLDYFENIDNFYLALKTLFEDLNIPVNYIAEEPARPQDILTNTFKEANPAFKLMEDVYFLGMVDDAAFEGNKSISADKIKTDYDGLLLFGVTLKERGNGLLPTRSHLAEITRAFNREFHYTPVVVVFRYNQYIAFANAERQKYKQEWREGEKAGKVSLLRDIDLDNPHSGHLRILSELAISRSGKKAINSFADLYTYWQDVFSVSLLNKKFYEELFKWYLWAVKEVTFPSKPTVEDVIKETGKIDDKRLEELRQEHNAKNIIRLLTRFLFVWFVKEKNLIPEELFDIDYLKDELLKDLSPVHYEGLLKEANIESVYYKAILQNLFFASLNCPIEPLEKGDNRERGFRLRDNFGQHRDANYLMRYKDQFKNPEKFLKLINDVVPFLNGGLFECLDNKTDKIYIDGFSDNLVKPHQLIVPDYLFFGFDQEVDLSGVVGINTNAYKKASVKGLIHILESYKFTIAENTPIEEDVALDPELLGKVFENLLASYNPETKTTARKQTGSFYTPREIVNYMVDESLIAYLKNSVKNWNIDADELDKQLHCLLSFDNINPFAENDDLQKQIIHSLDNCKVLDPACGSGAFPMGILQKMVHVLQKVDPENKYWQELQLNKAVKQTEGAFTITDKKEREQKLIEINDAFDEKINDPDYARKLFLVENCIYGVDIQEIAAQISKLRFFISLVVDQKVDKDKPNFGIRALPNLETKFVTANTLIGIDKPAAQGNLFESTEVKDLEQELKNIRHRLFSAKSPATKRRLRDKDKEIREKMGELLVDNGWANETAKQLASWDPYDQNASSPFFDPEWMFDIKDGFDIVIGNPPYIDSEEMTKSMKALRDYCTASFISTKGNWDIYIPFFEIGIRFLMKNGILSYITPNKWLSIGYGKALRSLIFDDLMKLCRCDKINVFEAGNSPVIVLFKKNYLLNEVFVDEFNEQGSPNSIDTLNKTQEINNDNLGILLSDNLKLLKLIKSGNDEVSNDFIVENPFTTGEAYQIKEILYSDNKTEKCFKFVNTGTIDPYCNLWGKKNTTYLKDKYEYPVVNISNFKKYFPKRFKQVSKPKIIITGMRYFESFLDIYGTYIAGKSTIIVSSKSPNITFLKLLLGLFNSKLISFYIKQSYSALGIDGGVNFNRPMIEQLPYPKMSSRMKIVLENIVNQILFTKRDDNNKGSSFELIIDALVFQLYFPNHMKEKEIDTMKFVEQDLKEVLGEDDFEQLSDEQKENVIEELHKRWSNPDSEIVKRMNSFAEKSPDILKPILESK